LSETALAVALGLSKTPVRESEGLVEVQPQRGTFVFRISASEAHNLSELREVLEVSALRLPWRRTPRRLGQTLAGIADKMRVALGAKDAGTYLEQAGRFHHSIIDRCDNHYLSRADAIVAFRIQTLRKPAGHGSRAQCGVPRAASRRRA